MALATGGARALGGWFFGRRGDLVGRKSAFSLTVLIATLPSWGLFFLSFLLSYEKWSIYSTIIFALIKFFQGVSAGGELPGAICYLAEADVQKNTIFRSRLRYRCSYALFGAQIGLALSSLVCLILKSIFPIEMLITHGWRYVFLGSAILGLGGFVIRAKLHETKAFLAKRFNPKINLSPIKELFSKYKKHAFYAFFLSIFEVVSFSVMSILPMYYSKDPFKLSSEMIILINLSFSLLCVLFLPVIGFFSSKYYKFPWLKTSALGSVVFSFFLYNSLANGNFLISLCINIAMIFLFSIQAAILPSVLANLFPVQVRYTGIAFSFNICDGILWPIITGITSWLIINNSLAFIIFLPLTAIFFIIISLFGSNNKEVFIHN